MSCEVVRNREQTAAFKLLAPPGPEGIIGFMKDLALPHCFGPPAFSSGPSGPSPYNWFHIQAKERCRHVLQKLRIWCRRYRVSYATPITAKVVMLRNLRGAACAKCAMAIWI